MGILDGLAGRGTAVDTAGVAEEMKHWLVEGEAVEVAFKVMRDMIVFTNFRLITVDRQGVTGKKVNYRSVPYSRVTQFSKEAAGTFDLDAELKIWVGSNPEPINFSFTKDAPIDDVYRVLSNHILK